MGKIHTHVLVENLTTRGRKLMERHSTHDDGALMLMAASKLREHGREIIELRENQSKNERLWNDSKGV